MPIASGANGWPKAYRNQGNKETGPKNMWGNVRNSMYNNQAVYPEDPAPQSPPPPYKSRQNSPQQRPRYVDVQPKNKNVYYGNSPNKERYVGPQGGNVRGGKCGECCLGTCCCMGGPGCFPFPGRDKNMEGCCKFGCCRGPCCFGCCCGEGVWSHLDPDPGRGKTVPGSCCGTPYESLNDTHKPRRCRRLGALLLFVALPLLLAGLGLGVFFGLQAKGTSDSQDSIENQAPGGYYQDGAYFYPVPQDAVDNYYRVIGQDEIDACFEFLRMISVTIPSPTTTVNGTTTTTTPPSTQPVTTIAETTEPDTTVKTTLEDTTTVVETTTVTEVTQTTGTAGTSGTAFTGTTVVTTEAPTTTVEETTTVPETTVEITTTTTTADMTTTTTMTTTTSYMGTIPDCYALTTRLEYMNTPMTIAGGAMIRSSVLRVVIGAITALIMVWPY